MKKTLLMFASLLGFLPNAPYLLHAWRNSRLDSLDWIFYTLSVPAAVWVARENKPEKCDHWGWLLLTPAAFLLAGRSLHNINAASVLGSVWFVWSVIWILGGWHFAYRWLPVFLILTLGTPSLTYQLSQWAMISVSWAIVLKFMLASAGFLWIFCNGHFRWRLRKESAFFLAAALFSALLLRSKDFYFTGRSFVPDYSLRVGRFVGRSITPDAETRRFFATSDVQQYRYAVGDSDLAVLSVHCGDNIHEIHPASHCLRTSQWKVESEKPYFLQPDFAVTEIEAQKGPIRILVWVWYSGREFSSPSFFGFRRHFRPGGDYYTCQISIPVTTEVAESRKLLLEFVNALSHEVNHDGL